MRQLTVIVDGTTYTARDHVTVIVTDDDGKRIVRNTTAEAPRQKHRRLRKERGLCGAFGCNTAPEAGKSMCRVHLDAVAARNRKCRKNRGQQPRTKPT